MDDGPEQRPDDTSAPLDRLVDCDVDDPGCQPAPAAVRGDQRAVVCDEHDRRAVPRPHGQTDVDCRGDEHVGHAQHRCPRLGSVDAEHADAVDLVGHRPVATRDRALTAAQRARVDEAGMHAPVATIRDPRPDDIGADTKADERVVHRRALT